MTKRESVEAAAREIIQAFKDYEWAEEEPCWAYAVCVRGYGIDKWPRVTIFKNNSVAGLAGLNGPRYDLIVRHYDALDVPVTWDFAYADDPEDLVLWRRDG
jgi:hypothetical protein